MARTVPNQPGSLLVLTGASHTGKSSVATAILEIVTPPAAWLGVDRVLSQLLFRPGEDRWAQIPLAYELLKPQVSVLLDRGWLVIYESTFTYIPEDDEPEPHPEKLEELLAVAEMAGATSTVVQLQARPETLLARSAETTRLSDRIVSATHALHLSQSFPGEPHRVDSERAEPADLARTIVDLAGLS